MLSLPVFALQAHNSHPRAHCSYWLLYLLPHLCTQDRDTGYVQTIDTKQSLVSIYTGPAPFLLLSLILSFVPKLVPLQMVLSPPIPHLWFLHQRLNSKSHVIPKCSSLASHNPISIGNNLLLVMGFMPGHMHLCPLELPATEPLCSSGLVEMGLWWPFGHDGSGRSWGRILLGLPHLPFSLCSFMSF